MPLRGRFCWSIRSRPQLETVMSLPEAVIVAMPSASMEATPGLRWMASTADAGSVAANPLRA
jgi:hypothetical protein